MSLSTTEKDILNNSNPVNQKISLGDEVYNNSVYSPVVLSAAITADATGGLSIDVPFNMTIYDVVVVATAASGSGTVTLRSSTNAISDAIACAVDTTVARAGTLDDTYTAVTSATSLNVITNGANDRGLVYVYGIRS